MTKDEALRVLERYGVYGCGVCLQDGIEHYQIENGSATLYLDAEEALKLAIDALKTEAEPVRHGYWTRIVKQGYAQDWFCSVCGETGRGDYAWCPRCGARMDKETEE